MSTSTNKQVDAFESAPVRLSRGETRCIMQCQTTGRSTSYECRGLVELGLMVKRRDKKSEDIGTQLKKQWLRLQSAADRESRSDVNSAIREMDNITRDAKSEHFVLTDLGKQVARGITVRMKKL